MTFEVDSRNLRATLQRLAESVEDQSDALDAIGSKLVELIHIGLIEGVSPNGQPLKPLSSVGLDARYKGKRYGKKGATTSKYYKHMTGPHQPLMSTSQHIYNRINHQMIGKDTVLVGLRDGPEHIGAVHQFGATIVPKRAKYLAIPFAGGVIFSKKAVIPARPYLPIDQSGNVDMPTEWQQEIEDIIDAKIGKAIS